MHIILNDSNSYIKLYNFLSENQEKVVNLCIEYNENTRLYFTKTQAAILNVDNYVNFLNQKKLKNIPKDKQMESRYGFGKISDYACVFSDFKSSPYNNLFLREHGSIGIYVDNDNIHKSIAYIIIIQESSEDNTLYMWNSINSTKNGEQSKMQLSGVFFVNKFIDEQLCSIPMFRFLPPLWYKKNTRGGTTKETVIELSPISQKNISKHTY